MQEKLWALVPKTTLAPVQQLESLKLPLQQLKPVVLRPVLALGQHVALLHPSSCRVRGLLMESAPALQQPPVYQLDLLESWELLGAQQ